MEGAHHKLIDTPLNLQTNPHKGEAKEGERDRGSLCNLGMLCNNKATFAPQNTALFMDAFSVDDNRTTRWEVEGKNATNL